jgi:hypothetical protein
LRHLAQARFADFALNSNLPLVDFYSALVESSTGDYRTGLAVDGVHPTLVAAQFDGRYFPESGRQRISCRFPVPPETAFINIGLSAFGAGTNLQITQVVLFNLTKN